MTISEHVTNARILSAWEGGGGEDSPSIIFLRFLHKL